MSPAPPMAEYSLLKATINEASAIFCIFVQSSSLLLVITSASQQVSFFLINIAVLCKASSDNACNAAAILVKRECFIESVILLP